MGYGRAGRKSSQIPPEELQEIRRKERANKRRNKRIKKPEAVAGDVKKMLVADLGKPLTSQQIVAIDSEERRHAFMAAFFKYCGNIASACAFVGITRSTFNRWVQKYPEIKEQIEELNEAILDLAEQQLLKNIEAGKENSLFFLLCNKGKHRGWQDIRKLSAPQLNAIKININYPEKNSESQPMLNVGIVEAEIIEQP